MYPIHDGQWREGLSRCLSVNRVPKHLLGVGNQLGRDDGVGLEIVSRLKRRCGARPRSDVVIHPPVFYQERLLSKLAGERATLVIFDAVDYDMEPGRIFFAKLSEMNFGFFATHNVPMRLIPGVARSLADAWLAGVQPKDTTLGEGLSEIVGRAANQIVDAVCEELEHGRH